MKPLKRRETPLERLVDAEPAFYGWAPDRALNPHLSDKPDRRGLGLSFLCPIHEDCHLAVPFDNPLDAAAPEASGHLWHRDGDTFETLTLSPSIHILNDEHVWIVTIRTERGVCASCRATQGTSEPCDGCGWHGFIRNGRFETCADAR